ncbi:MAG TPA: delta-60 repeat domain-containing protein, partial [Bacteroidia bacterium]|nr:delta-60 repeat domain-containing protein [Bacteroidia bacterium]
MKTSLLKTTRFKHLAILTLLLYFIFAAILLKGQDGKNDVTFNTYDKAASQGTNGGVTISAIQSDNKIIISGNFTSYNGEPVNGMAR